MSRLFVTKVLRQLRRPLPDLCGYLHAKLLSAIWRPYLAAVGQHFHISRGARLQGGSCIRIGARFFAGPGLWIEAVRRYESHVYSPRISIGDGVTCSDFVHLTATCELVVGNGVLFGSRVHVTDHAHGRYVGDIQDSPDIPPVHRTLSSSRPVHIGDNVWLGDGVVVLPGVRVGAGTVVGANSVVSRDLPPNVIAIGAPARPIKRWDAGRAAWVRIESPA